MWEVSRSGKPRDSDRKRSKSHWGKNHRFVDQCDRNGVDTATKGCGFLSLIGKSKKLSKNNSELRVDDGLGWVGRGSAGRPSDHVPIFFHWNFFQTSSAGHSNPTPVYRTCSADTR